MKKIFGIVALGAMAVLGATDASAVCANNLTFGQSLANCGGGYCYVVTPGGGVPSSGSFWSLSTGNSALGSGNDNGTWGVAGWCRPATPGCYLSGGWAADGGIDGCIDGLFAPGKAVENMVVQFSTVSGGQGWYAAAAASRNNAGLEFEFASSGQSITLQPIPAPTITNSTRNADFSVNITVGAPALGAFSSDGSATAADVIKSYRVYKQVLARGATAPSSRDLATGGWVAAGAATAVGTPFSFTETACSTNSDIYLATSVLYDSNYETPVLSANSKVIQCGPQIADPNKGFKVIDRKGGAKRDATIN